MKIGKLAAMLSGLRARWHFPGQITLGARPLLILAALALASIGWAFYIGLLVGRDEQPHEAVPALGELFHKDKSVEDAQPAVPDENQARPDAAHEAASQEVPDALPPQDAAQDQDAVQSTADAASPAVAMSGEAAGAWPAPPARAAAPEARRPRHYQIAAFRTSGEAAALAARIRIPGLKTRVEPSGKVFLVTGSGRLSDAEDAAMRESLAEMGLGRPLPLARKGAAQKPAGQKAAVQKSTVRKSSAPTPKAKAAPARKATSGQQAKPAKAGSASARGASKATQKRTGRQQ